MSRKWERKVGVTALEKCGVKLCALEQETELRIAKYHTPQPGLALDLDIVNQTVLSAVGEARLLKNNYVGTEHLMLALMTSQDHVAATLLNEYGVTYDLLKSTISELTGSI